MENSTVFYEFLKYQKSRYRIIKIICDCYCTKILKINVNIFGRVFGSSIS